MWNNQQVLANANVKNKTNFASVEKKSKSFLIFKGKFIV